MGVMSQKPIKIKLQTGEEISVYKAYFDDLHCGFVEEGDLNSFICIDEVDIDSLIDNLVTWFDDIYFLNEFNGQKFDFAELKEQGFIIKCDDKYGFNEKNGLVDTLCGYNEATGEVIASLIPVSSKFEQGKMLEYAEEHARELTDEEEKQATAVEKKVLAILEYMEFQVHCFKWKGQKYFILYDMQKGEFRYYFGDENFFDSCYIASSLKDCLDSFHEAFFDDYGFDYEKCLDESITTYEDCLLAFDDKESK